MAATALPGLPPDAGLRRRISTLLYQRRTLTLFLLLTPPLLVCVAISAATSSVK